ncbi:hypothetical protein, partial [Shewanella surugensis]
MDVLVITHNAVVTNLIGQLKVKDLQGNIRDLSIGDIVKEGEQLIFSPNTKFDLRTENNHYINEQGQFITDPVDIDDETPAIQTQTPSGDNSTLDSPDAVEGGFDFITVERQANETRAESGHDTKGFQITTPSIAKIKNNEDPLFINNFIDENEIINVPEDGGAYIGNVINTVSPDGPITVVSFSIADQAGPFVLNQAITITDDNAH